MSKFILNLPTQIIFLKSGYNIPLKDTANQSLQLLIELGDFGISLIWTDTQKKQIAALAVFIFEDEDDKVEQIRNTINRFVITGKEQKSLKIFYNFRESMLVPSKYYNEELNEQMLSLLFGENDDAVIRTDKLDNLEIYNIYRLPIELDKFITNTFPQVNSFHSTTTQCHSCSSILLAVSCLFKIVLTSHIFLELFLYLCFLFLFIVNFFPLPFTLLFENNFVRCVCEIIQPPFIFLTANHDHFQPFQDISNHHAYFRAVSTTYHNSFYSLLNLKATLPIFIFTFIFFHRKLFNIIENH
jgi:hypothetical protein